VSCFSFVCFVCFVVNVLFCRSSNELTALDGSTTGHRPASPDRDIVVRLETASPRSPGMNRKSINHETHETHEKRQKSEKARGRCVRIRPWGESRNSPGVRVCSPSRAVEVGRRYSGPGIRTQDTPVRPVPRTRSPFPCKPRSKRP
jgi:hypothetical protein